MISEFLLGKIDRKDLLYDKAYIGGKWVSSSSNETISVINPATGAEIATIPNLTDNDVQHAIDAAKVAFITWSELLPRERANLLRNWHDLILDNTDDLAKILTAEQGKPLHEAIGEIKYAASFVEWFAEEAARIHGDVYPVDRPDVRYLGMKEPIGVTAAITPWNFPSSMVTRKTAPALAAGCTLILKPSDHTPLSALALAYLANEAGISKGVFNVVTGNAKVIGKKLCDSKDVRKLSFTGSTETGKALYTQCGTTLKKLSLELGGNAPFIVFDDANLELAAEGLSSLKSRSTGQACTSANRIFIHESVYDAFIKLVIAEYSKLVMCDGFDKECEQGPLISYDSVKRVASLVEEAVAAGGRILYQGNAPQIGCFFPTTVIEVPDVNLRIHGEEIFGPVIAIYKFSTDEELIKKANNTDYGLSAYFFSNNKSRIWNIAKALEFGMVGINSSKLSNAAIPFGGVKFSGFGREGSKYGIEEFMHIKYYCFGDI